VDTTEKARKTGYAQSVVPTIPSWDIPLKSFRPPCERCGAPAVLIAYGLPGPTLEAAAARGDVELGGCVVHDDAPLWCCWACRGRLPHGGLCSPFREYCGGQLGPFRDLLGRLREARTAAALRDLVPDLLASEGGRLAHGFAACWRLQWRALQRAGLIPASERPPAWPRTPAPE
jgi:hypothetical protein